MVQVCGGEDRFRGRTSLTDGGSCRFVRGPDHFALHRIVERDPGGPKFGGKCGAKLLFEAPDHCIAKRDEVRLVDAESRVAAAGMGNDRLPNLLFKSQINGALEHDLASRQAA